VLTLTLATRTTAARRDLETEPAAWAVEQRKFTQDTKATSPEMRLPGRDTCSGRA
jgi:hypothetical protein